MTTLAPPAAPAPAAAPARWRPNRWTFIVLAAVLLGVGVTVWAQRGSVPYPGDLDPRNPSTNGAQALAKVLADQGVDVRIARSADELDARPMGPDTTLVVTAPEALAPTTLRRMLSDARGATVVVVDADQRTIGMLAPGQTVTPTSPDGVVAGCAAGVGVPLDALRLTVDSGLSYRGEGCFSSGGGRSMLVRSGGLLLFGGGQALSNDQILRGDDAAIGLRLLGQHEHLVWYVPSAEDALPGEQTAASLIPRWIGPSLVLGLIALIALALWRGRRLGPLVVEPLPAVVRAAETAYSRGRLYVRSRDRAHAAGILRRTTRRALAHTLRLDPAATEQAVVDAVAERLALSPAYVADILTTGGRVPATDKELIWLAQELDRLTREVRR